MIKEQTLIKKDTSTNWNKAKNFIPKAKEIIVYTDFDQIKIGDGKTKVNDLPFVDDNEYAVEEDILIINTKGGFNYGGTFKNKTEWNNL